MAIERDEAARVGAVRAAVAEALGMSADAVPPDAARGGLPGWDSLNHLAVIAAVERRFGVELSLAELRDADSVPALAALLAAKRAGG